MEEDIFDFGEEPQVTATAETNLSEEPGLFDDPDEGQEPSSSDNGDYLSQFLYSRGIDANNIPITNEDGTVENLSFEDLSDEDKLQILNSTNELPITDEEIQTINFLRQNKVSLEDYVKGQIDKALSEQPNALQTYTVDQFTDEELYKYELGENYPDLTEQEIEDELQRAKENPELFQKKVDILRKTYKELESNQEKIEQEQRAQEQENNWMEMQNSLIDYATNLSDLHNLELSDNDKNEVLSFLLDKDVNGNTEFFKRCDDPAFLFNVAWYALKGNEAFQAINDYYKGIIENSRRQPNKVAYRNTSNKLKQEDAFGLDLFFKK